MSKLCVRVGDETKKIDLDNSISNININNEDMTSEESLVLEYNNGLKEIYGSILLQKKSLSSSSKEFYNYHHFPSGFFKKGVNIIATPVVTLTGTHHVTDITGELVITPMENAQGIPSFEVGFEVGFVCSTPDTVVDVFYHAVGF